MREGRDWLSEDERVGDCCKTLKFDCDENVE